MKPQTEIIIRKDDAELERRTVEAGEYVIGRSDDADLRIDTPAASARHAKLTVKSDAWLVEDLHSESGTFINGQRLAPHEAVPVFPSQALRVGDTTVTLRRLHGEEAETVAPGTAAVRAMLPEELRAQRYIIGSTVARGGMGEILNAEDQMIRRSVAMKIMLADGGDPTRFIEEAQITGQLEHPNIVPVYELGVDARGQPFYTMKFVRGISLGAVLRQLAQGVPEIVQKYPLGALLTVFQKVGDALAFAHSKGVIHRDLKPENIMLGEFGEALVMDWGLAKLLGTPSGESAPVRSARQEVASNKTLTGTIMGTPQYMAPEQARGKVDELDTRADVYALGAILYHILTLEPPAGGADVEKLLAEVRLGRIIHPRERVRGKRLPHLPDGQMPDSLAAVAMRALALRPADRYASVPEMQSEIAAFQSGFATKAERASLGRQFVLLVRRHRVATAAAALILALIAVFAWKVTQEGRRATAALDRLRYTAPAFAKQASALAEAGRFTDALDQIAIAIELDDTNPAHHLFRANTLQALANLGEASEAYRMAIERNCADPSAETNLRLCRALLRKNGGNTALTTALKSELLDAILAQGRKVDAQPLSKELGREPDYKQEPEIP